MMVLARDNHRHVAQLHLSSEVEHFEYRGSTYIIIFCGFPNPKIWDIFSFDFRIFDIRFSEKICGSSLGTQSELAPSSDRAERAVDGPHASRIIIQQCQHHSINMTVPGGDPESLEQHFAVKTVLLSFSPRVSDPLIYWKHLTDFSEIPDRVQIHGSQTSKMS